MKGLLLKDFYLLKNVKKTLFLFALIGGILLMPQGNEGFVMGYTNVCIVSVILGSTAYDDYNNGFAFLMTLPVTREEYVKEKYGFGILCCVSGWLVTAAVTTASTVVRGGMELPQWALVCAVFLGIALLAFAIAQPFCIKYGSEKGRITMVVFLMFLFAVLYFVIRFGKKMGFDWKEVLYRLLNGAVGPAILAAVVLLIVYISFRAGVEIMNKKEL